MEPDNGQQEDTPEQVVIGKKWPFLSCRVTIQDTHLNIFAATSSNERQ